MESFLPLLQRINIEYPWTFAEYANHDDGAVYL